MYESHPRLVRTALLTVAFALLTAGLPRLACAAPNQTAPDVTPTRFTINVVEAPVADVLYALFMAAKRNYTIGPAISGNVTLTANNVTFQQALAVLLDSGTRRWPRRGYQFA